MNFYILGEFCRHFDLSVNVSYSDEFDIVLIELTKDGDHIDPAYKKYKKSIPMLMSKKIDTYDILRSFVYEMGLSKSRWEAFVKKTQEVNRNESV